MIFPPSEYLSLDVADIRDIAAMKVDAIATRGTKRDFVDLYFICNSGCPLEKVLRIYDQRYGELASNMIHIQKSLLYFSDAEPEEMPQMLKKISWDQIRKYFEDEVRKLQH